MEETFTLSDFYLAIPLIYIFLRFVFVYKRTLLRDISFYFSTLGLLYYILIMTTVTRGMFVTIFKILEEIGIEFTSIFGILISLIFILLNYYLEHLAQKSSGKNNSERIKVLAIFYSSILIPALSAFILLLFFLTTYFVSTFMIVMIIRGF
ncbi:hypothetical protein A2865_01360 [Candidatus Woesebacteria bacterium RIFCSPHIGHO2_01_FULL_39_17]|uniref:Uncharacterized protein n=3 Tax=Candidatus Woeseibacteriota TaxID=1752722 RepID=A0A0G0N7B1_9BACT|nr:MAG: hypothetical protein US72_C0004G0053 [Microgenomates group bacterium GW2011_GWC1_38_12]KKQ93343.1 MAG: hypothetical protein UT19_C0013G0007 [Candidatus Woesebacteria bacterium GW2011_GWB1_39_10b]KKR12059.1 MAG: hypothetical protein UT40_C0029G0011 [Candidatus Woesebacteria bacterium GW2011_GWA1_39_21b]OGM23714.1 MAG: hypothetical protein A2865_01360 [Candidatus Woesebacteria bacterium RIFCSPHIGHO2_01_FULL_39_17]OGM65427.1 MAG: hypothetical protein A3A52_03580 [Candidatus Woesebacteria b